MATNTKSPTSIQINNHSDNKILFKLFSQPYEFSFDQACYILEKFYDKCYKTKNVSRETFSTPPIKFLIKSTISFNIPNSEVNKIEKNYLDNNKQTIWINFLSLSGIQGPLPIPYSEIILQRIKLKDYATADFLDIFNQRLAYIIYQIRLKNHINSCPTNPLESSYGKVKSNIGGLRPNTIKKYNDNWLNLYDYLWAKGKSAQNFSIIAKSILEIDFTINQWQGKWQQSLPYDQTTIGNKKGNFNYIGVNAIIGTKTWDQQSGIAIKLSKNVSWQKIVDFSPFGESYNSYDKLIDIAQKYLGGNIEIKISIDTQSPNILKAKLGSSEHHLGFNSVI